MLKTLMGGDKSARRLQALEALRANVMIADAELNITYMNPAVRELLQETEADIRKELPISASPS